MAHKAGSKCPENRSASNSGEERTCRRRLDLLNLTEGTFGFLQTTDPMMLQGDVYGISDGRMWEFGRPFPVFLHVSVGDAVLSDSLRRPALPIKLNNL